MWRFTPRTILGRFLSLVAVSLLGLSLLSSSPALAQQAASGFELALHGGSKVVAGKAARYRGIVYRVRGLAQLQPLADARVRARYHSEQGPPKAWQEVRADRSGFFQIDVLMPSQSQGDAKLEIEVGDGKSEREFHFPLSFESPWKLDLVADRRLYEPGETIYAWARLRDTQSKRPIAARELTMSFAGTGIHNQKYKTGESGVAFAKVVIPKETKEGSYELIAKLDGREVSKSYKVGTRTYERLFAEVKITPEIASPHQQIDIVVKVTTASGALVRNAQVMVKVDSVEMGARSDGDGLARIAMQAPAYMTHSTGSVAVSAKVNHPAHGETNAFTNLRLAVPLTLTVEAVPGNGALVPELPGVIYLRLSRGKDKPAPLGTPVEVIGAAIAGGRTHGKTDAHGFVTIPTRLPRGAATGSEEEATTTLIVHVKGKAPRTASFEVAVARQVEVMPVVDKPVVSPGESLSIRLLRRSSAAKVPVIVEFFSKTGLVEARKLKAGVNRLTFKAPGDRLGVMTVRARPLHQKSVVEGTGGVDAFLVRPPKPSFPTLEADKEVYSVGKSAKLKLKTVPGAGKAWVALLVRDLAAHSGEYPFRKHFLARAFDKAILDPNAKTADTLLRTAMSDWIYRDQSPRKAPKPVDALGEEGEEGYDLASSTQRGVLRDPYPLAEELSRRGVGVVMRDIEEMLREALSDGRLSELVTRRGQRSQFKSSIFAEFNEHPLSLGEGELSLAMLVAADPSFSYDNIGKRVARLRLMELLVALAMYLDPGDDASPQQRAAAREPSDRWLSRMIERGLINAEQLADPWGNSFTLRRSSSPAIAVAIEAASLELVSPGPDGKLGTRDDISDPFARAVPAGTPYAIASGEDRLMAQLARLSPGSEVLRRLLEAYQRVTAEIAEEEIGDAVGASVSEGWGTIGSGNYGVLGHGSGTGSGYGSGSGRGGMRGRASRPPSVRMGAGGSGVRGFARVVREKFPSTLLFAPAVELDSSGSTELTVPLSDAVTTYLVEAVVWTADGWTWSTDLEIRVDKEIVIDAPVPTYATVGDVIRLPIRIGNRSPRDRKLEVAVFAPGNVDTPMAERRGVLVPGKDTVVEAVGLQLKKAMKGSVTVGVRSAKSVALDAVRRPITVQEATRRVRKSVDILAGVTESDRLHLEVHERATPREGSHVRVRVGAGLFAASAASAESLWAAAWNGESTVSRDLSRSLYTEEGSALAMSIAVAWRNSHFSDRVLGEALRRLTRNLAAQDKVEDQQVRVVARTQILLRLAPVTQYMGARQDMRDPVQELVRKLRKDVQSEVTQVSEDPRLWAMGAAALALSAPPKSKLKRVRELVRRVRRHQLRVGSLTWVATSAGVHETSAMLALAELKLGDRGRALALLRTLAKLTLGKRLQDPWTMALARVAAQKASPGGPPSHIEVRIDGAKKRISLSGGAARMPAPSLSRPGSHTISVKSTSKGTDLYHVEAVSEHGLPWDLVPPLPGSIVATWEGELGRVGEPSELELIVRNRSPRTIANPIVEISLPAGAELDEKAKRELRRHTRGESEATRGTLRLRLAGLPPGATRKIPISFRWSVGGKLQGLGLASFPENRPDDISILKPRVLKLRAAKVSP